MCCLPIASLQARNAWNRTQCYQWKSGRTDPRHNYTAITWRHVVLTAETRRLIVPWRSPVGKSVPFTDNFPYRLSIDRKDRRPRAPNFSTLTPRQPISCGIRGTERNYGNPWPVRRAKLPRRPFFTSCPRTPSGKYCAEWRRWTQKYVNAFTGNISCWSRDRIVFRISSYYTTDWHELRE